MEVGEVTAIVDLPADKEPAAEQDVVKDDDMNKNNFEKINDADGNDKFKCKVCDHKVNTEGGMKRHIMTKHVNPKDSKKRKMDDDTENGEDKKAKVDEVADDPDDMDLVDRILAGNAYTSTQSNNEVGDTTIAALDKPFNETKSQEEELAEARSKLLNAEEDMEVLKANAEEDKAKIASLEEAIENMKQLMVITKATNNSLEIESHNKDVKINKVQKAIKLQDTAIKKMQAEARKNVNATTENTIKSLKEENKIKRKEAEEANKRATEAVKRLKDETNAKAEAQSEVVRMSKIVDSLTALLDLKKKEEKKRSRSRDQDRSKSRDRKGRQESSYKERKRKREERSRERRRKSRSSERSRKSRSKENRMRSKSSERSRKGKSTEESKEKTADIPCKDYRKPGGCSYGARCKFSHKEDYNRKKDDCDHWLKDDSKFADRVCRDKHDPSKRGMNLNRSRMEAGQGQGFGNPSMGLAGQGVIYGGGVPQFPLLGGQGVQGGSVWGQPGQPQLLQIVQPVHT